MKQLTILLIFIAGCGEPKPVNKYGVGDTVYLTHAAMTMYATRDSLHKLFYDSAMSMTDSSTITYDSVNNSITYKGKIYKKDK